MELIKKRKIMGTDIEIILNADTSYSIIQNDMKICFSIFSYLEKIFSRFDKNSTLSKLNSLKKLEVEDVFLKVLELSKEIYNLTEGYFNPLVSVSSIGYVKSFENKESFFKKEEAYDLDLSKIEINGNRVILKENQNLDFGGIVKGFTVDLVRDYLVGAGYKDFIVNAGGDVFVGTIKSKVAVMSPFKKNSIFAVVELENFSVSTSGTYKRTWQIDGETYNHILNPKTSKNTDEIVSISVFGKDTYLTDAIATSCIAMGFEKAKNLLENQKLEAIIILKNNSYFLVGDLSKYNFKLVN